VCVCLFYVPPSSDLVKDVCESLFDNVTKGWRESERGIQGFFVYYRHCESKGDSGGGRGVNFEAEDSNSRLRSSVYIAAPSGVGTRLFR